MGCGDNVDKSGKTLMELLELEMRARAIKALLGNKKPLKVNAVDANQDKGSNERAVVTWGENSYASLCRYS